MLSKKTDLSGAIEWISSFHDEIVDQFLRTAEDVREHRNGVPSWGHDLDQQVSAYINGLGQHREPFSRVDAVIEVEIQASGCVLILSGASNLAGMFI